MSNDKWTAMCRGALIRTLDAIGATAIAIPPEPRTASLGSSLDSSPISYKWGLHIRKENRKDNVVQFGRHGTCQALIGLGLGVSALKLLDASATHYDKFLVGGTNWLRDVDSSEVPLIRAKRNSDYGKTLKVANLLLASRIAESHNPQLAVFSDRVEADLIAMGVDAQWPWSQGSSGSPDLGPTVLALRALSLSPTYVIKNALQVQAALTAALRSIERTPENVGSITALLHIGASLRDFRKHPLLESVCSEAEDLIFSLPLQWLDIGRIETAHYDTVDAAGSVRPDYERLSTGLMHLAFYLETPIERSVKSANIQTVRDQVRGLIYFDYSQWANSFFLTETYAWLSRIFSSGASSNCVGRLLEDAPLIQLSDGPRMATTESPLSKVGNITQIVTESKTQVQLTAKIATHFLLCGTEWGSSKGGLSTFNRELAIGLAKIGATVSCVVRSISEGDRESAAASGIKLIPISPPAGISAEGYFAFHFDNVSPDVVVGHDHVTGPYARQLREIRFPAAKFVFFIHTTPWSLEHAKGKDGSLQKAGMKEQVQISTSEAADLVVAVGSYIAKSIKRSLQRIAKAIPVHQFNPGPYTSVRARVDSQHTDERICLFIGRAEDAESKGLDFLRSLIGHYLTTHPAPLVFFELRGIPESEIVDFDKNFRGSPPNSTPGKVRIRPYSIESDEIDGDFNSASLVLMPSRVEGYGLVALEAISRGIPVIVSSESGFAEAIADMGAKLAPSLVCRAPLEGSDPSAENDWAGKMFGLLSREFEEVTKDVKGLCVQFESAGHTWDNSAQKLVDAIATPKVPAG